MATQKQRRRRAKEKRHQYDLVEIDGEGNETVLSSSDLKSEAPSTPSSHETTTRAFSVCAFMRSTSVRSPRWVRKESSGPGTAPIEFCRKASFSCSS